MPVDDDEGIEPIETEDLLGGPVNIHFNYTSASIVAIIGAAISVAVAFGVDLASQQINAVLTLVGLIAAAVTIGGGVKTAALMRSGEITRSTGIHFTMASISAIVGSLIAVAVAFGLDISQGEQDAILKLVGLLGGGLVIGGALKSQGALLAGIHPGYLRPGGKGTTSSRPRG